MNRPPLTSFLLIATAAVSTVSASAFYFLWDYQKGESSAYHTRLEHVESHLKALQELYRQKRNHMNQILTELQSSYAMNKSLQQEMEQNRLELDRISEEAKSDRSRSDALEEKLEWMTSELDEYKKQTRNSDTDIQHWQLEIARLSEENRELKEQLTRHTPESKTSNQKEVELGKIVVDSGQGTETTHQPASQGKVITVNRPYDFVVVDLGKRDGVRIGDMLKIHHDREVIGVVRVERVYETLCAASILNDEVRHKVAETDRVTPVTG